MPPGQQNLEQAIENIDKIVADFQCNRGAREIIEASWQYIIKMARESIQQQAIAKPAEPAKDKEDPEKSAS